MADEQSQPKNYPDCQGKPPQWASKVPRGQLQRLYETDARGILDTEQIEAVGWALWQRCDSILLVTDAHNGRIHCPSCGAVIEGEHTWAEDELIKCAGCGWWIPWSVYHLSYRGKQLFGANAVDIFQAYHRAFPQEKTDSGKMLLIDQLIHAFHQGIKEIGRPVATNLIQGSLKEVIEFLDALTSGEQSAAGVGDSQEQWHSTITSADWTRPFIKRGGEVEEI
jgi:hypothetical protein